MALWINGKWVSQEKPETKEDNTVLSEPKFPDNNITIEPGEPIFTDKPKDKRIRTKKEKV